MITTEKNLLKTMSSIEIANKFGYNYSHDCKGCGGKYMVFLNPSFANVEMKIKKSNDYVKVYRDGRQMLFTNATFLEEKLKQFNLVTA